jgi:4-hydroxyphenylpyruvate dioxygenase-like putative hemolysin
MPTTPSNAARTIQPLNFDEFLADVSERHKQVSLNDYRTRAEVRLETAELERQALEEDQRIVRANIKATEDARKQLDELLSRQQKEEADISIDLHAVLRTIAQLREDGVTLVPPKTPKAPTT